MSSLFIPVAFVILSGWILDVSDSLPAHVRMIREAPGERLEPGLSEMPRGEFHHGSADAALALSSHTRHHPEGELTSGRAAAGLSSGKSGHMDGHLTGEHHLSGHLGQSHHRGGELDGSGQVSLPGRGGVGLKEISGEIEGNLGHGAIVSEGNGLDKKAVALEVLRRMSMQNTKGGGTAAIPSGGLHAHGIDGYSAQGGRVEGNPHGGAHISGGGLRGGIHGNSQVPQADPSSIGLSGSGHSISSTHYGAPGGSAAGLEHMSGGQVHHPAAVTGGHRESPTGPAAGGLGVASGGQQEIVGELLEMWAKIGGPEMLGKIAAMSQNMHGVGAGALPTFSSHPPPPGAPTVGGSGTMGGNTQSFTRGEVSRGDARHITSAGSGAITYSGASSNASQPTEIVYVMMMPGSGDMPKGPPLTGSASASGGKNTVMGQLPFAYGSGAYATYNTAGTYKLAQGAVTPGAISYTAIPVGYVATSGYSVQSRPMYYSGTARPRGSTYTAWPMTYGVTGSKPYSMLSYTAVPVGQVVTARAQQGVRPAATAQAAYYTVQGGRTVATTQQRPAGGVTYTALPAVVMPAQTYKVASG
ncbi:uncharacterized transmembrane protein DDB_G0289901-like [Schistocerca cancellata]|uniref:uncharacterized transmembrane protein DDB_G0289901-like n=1 Tax=Schistocerca cancellata TaxID=274614 RepID=UPI002117778B|nr:uncharacterized transmembrane protein DDB_G0289901-like [Schistocerca cancellata]